MSELPYTTGLTDEFTTLVPTSVSASEWVNQKGSTNFILQNAEFADDTITLTGNNVAWLPIAEPTEYTAYILCKTYIPTPRSSAYAQFFGCINGANRCSVYIYMGTDTSKIYKLRTYNTSTYVNPTMDNWHVITLKRTSGYFYVYADGDLIISEANTATTRSNKFMIKSISDVGSTPTVDEAITVYLKYCAIFNTAQTDNQIKGNSVHILVDFGLKAPEKNSRLAGTDAVAIAYAIARNQESSLALQEMKKAYRDGVKQGVKDGADTTEDVEEDLPPNKRVEVTIEESAIVDPFVGDMTKGVYFTGGSGIPEGGYLKIYLDKAYETYYETTNSAWRGRLIFELYDADGNITATEWTQGQMGWKDYWYNIGESLNWTYKFIFNYYYQGEVMGYWYESKTGYTYSSDLWKPANTDIKNALANATNYSSFPKQV